MSLICPKTHLVSSFRTQYICRCLGHVSATLETCLRHILCLVFRGIQHVSKRHSQLRWHQSLPQRPRSIPLQSTTSHLLGIGLCAFSRMFHVSLFVPVWQSPFLQRLMKQIDAGPWIVWCLFFYFHGHTFILMAMIVYPSRLFLWDWFPFQNEHFCHNHIHLRQVTVFFDTFPPLTHPLLPSPRCEW